MIQSYSFWGYSDFDIIFGDVRSFLTETMLDDYDVFSFRPEYLTGSFTIYRNEEKMNTLFMQSKDYKKVFAEEKYYNFEECNFLFAPLQAGESIETLYNEIESMTHIIVKQTIENKIRSYFDFNLLEGLVGNIKWQDGRIIYKNKFEAILYHFLKFKEQCKNRKLKVGDFDTLYFSENTIYKKAKVN